MNVSVEPEPKVGKLLTRSPDRTGRVTLGAEYASMTVTVALDVVRTVPGPRGPIYVVEHESLETVDTDERGRMNVGVGRVGENLEIAVLEVRQSW